MDLSFYPFRKYRIPKEKTRHRTLTDTELATIAKIEIKEPLMAWARDMFLLSFCLIGMNMKDMMYIEKIEEGRINYKRSKGKRDYSIKVFPQALHIIYRYPGKKYLLNTLDNYADYRSATKRINKKLKDIVFLSLENHTTISLQKYTTYQCKVNVFFSLLKERCFNAQESALSCALKAGARDRLNAFNMKYINRLTISLFLLHDKTFHSY